MESLNHENLRLALQGALANLERNKENVNALNVFPVPDGDTGTNMVLTLKSAVKNGLEVSSTSIGAILQKTSQGSLMGARGNSGVILSQLFRGFAEALKQEETADVKKLAKAVKNASAVAYKAVMKPTEGTILTVAREMADFAMRIASSEEDILSFLSKILEEGRKSLANTPNLLPVLKEAGVVDAGGAGLLYILEGAYRALSGEKMDSPSMELAPEEPSTISSKTEITFGYCTEFMIHAKNVDIDKFRSSLAVMGDSLLVVSGEETVKVHVHTDQPGIVLTQALKLGALSDIKIDNMRFQHNEILLKKELEAKQDSSISSSELKKFSLISVCSGDGIEKLFRDLNVDFIVSGGQTMNPSTEDFIKAIDSTAAEHIFILPNNSNIILAAQQAKEMSSKDITVIPTKTIPQGITSLLQFNEEASLDENERNMTSAIDSVKTGLVTYAVRDTEINGRTIKTDDIIGLMDKEIVVNGNDISDVVIQLTDEMVDDGTSMITLFYGEDVEEQDAEKLLKTLDEKYSEIDIEIVKGNQPVYYYMISVE